MTGIIPFNHHRTADARIARIARAQHGVFTRTQAMKCGANRHAIERRLKSGRWQLIYPRVYRLAGTPETQRQFAIATCFYLGAPLSHRAAAAIRRLPDLKEARTEVTVRRNRNHPRLDNVIIHYPKHSIPDEDITTIDGIPVTKPARTLLDLATVEPEHVIERCLDDCLRRKLVSIPFLERWLDDPTRRRHRGYKVLRRLVDLRAKTAATESPLETDFLRFLRERGLPTPVVAYDLYDGDRFIGRIDCAYPDQCVAIELDGFTVHDRTRADFDHERARGNDVVSLGWQLLRITKKHMEQDPEGVAAWIRTTLGLQRRG